MPRKKASRQNAYIGKAGQLAVMAELALLGYNVALPEIDKGDDIFVVDDNTGKLWRLQVKGATEQQSRAGNYQVIVDDEQIQSKPEGESPDLHFVFALRRHDEKRWRFVVLPRAELKKCIDNRAQSSRYGGKFGGLNKKSGRRTLSITIKKSGDVACSREPWQKHMEVWETWWPRLDHEAIAAAKKKAAGTESA